MKVLAVFLTLFAVCCQQGRAAQKPAAGAGAATAGAAGGLRPRLDLDVGHGGRITATAVSPDGKTIASGSADRTIRLWDAQTGQMRRILKGHDADVGLVAFLPGGKAIVSGSTDGVVKQWDARTGAEQRTWTNLAAHESDNGMALSADGRTLAIAHTRTVKVWDLPGGTPRASITWGEDLNWLFIYKVVLSPDGNTVGVTGEYKQNDVNMSVVALWDVPSGKLLRTLSNPGGGVYSWAFSPDGRTLAASNTENAVLLWDVATGELRHTLKTPGPGGIWALAFSPDGQTVASGHQMGPSQVNLWDVRTGERKRTIPARDVAVYALAFSPDGRLLNGGGLDQTVKVWDAGSGELRRVLGRTETLASAVSPDGTLVAGAAGGADAEDAIRIWNTRTGEQGRVLEGHGGITVLSWSPDGKTLASGSIVNTVMLWDAATGRPLRTLTGHEGAVWDLDFSPDGKTLATSSFDKTVRLWNVETGQTLHTLSGHTDRVVSCDFSPDGRTLASAGHDAMVRVWDAQTGRPLQSLKPPTGVGDVSFSPDGRTLAGAGGAHGIWTVPSVVQVWDTQTWALRKTFKGPAMLPEQAATFSPDGKTVARGRGAYILLRDAATGERTRTLREHTSTVQHLNYSRDGKRLFSSGADMTIRVWETGTGRLLVTLRPLAPHNEAKTGAATKTEAGASFDYVALTPEGYYLGSPQADRYIRFNLGNDLFPAASFHARYWRPDLVREILAGKKVPIVHSLSGASPPLLSFKSAGGGRDAAAGGAAPVTAGEIVPLTVEVTDDSAVRAVTFLVNGARVDADVTPRGSVPLTQGERGTAPARHRIKRTFLARLTIPAGNGTVRVQAIAEDEDGLQSPRQEILFQRAKSGAVARSKGRLLGLFVGISRYRDESLNLNFADQDAAALAAALGQQQALYSKAQVTPLTNAAATRDAVRAGLDGLVREAGPTDTVILLLAGHGWRAGDNRFFFLTHEADRARPADTALPWGDVIGRLARLSQKSRRVLVLLDACHSGSAATNDDLVKVVLGANAGVMVFASSKGSEVSLEMEDLKHGVFTKAVLEAISGSAVPREENSVSLWDFASYVCRRVKTLTQGLQNPQVPFLQDFDTDAAVAMR